MLNSIGAAPTTVSGNPDCAVAVVLTAMSTCRRCSAKWFWCGAWMSTLTSAPLVVVTATSTVTPLAPWANPLVPATERARAVARVCVVVEQVVVRAGERRKVGRALLVASLGERRATVQHEADHRDDRNEGEGEDDDDLAAGGSSAGRPVRDMVETPRFIGSRPSWSTGGPTCR